MAGDWIKVHRKILKSAVWQDETVFRVWMWILLNANYERGQLLTGEIIEPGELVIGQDKLASELGMTRKRLRTALEKLVKCGNLGQRRASNGTHLTICNWQTYQARDEAKGPDRGQTGAKEGPDRGQTGATEEEETRKQEKKKQEKESFDARDIEIPGQLQDDRFRQAWATWIIHRIELKKKLTPQATSQQLKRLSEWGVTRACAAIEYTVSQGWQGIREPEASDNGKPKSKVPTREELDNWNPHGGTS